MPPQTVTPYAVEGDVDYDDLLDRFGADALTDDQRRRFPDPVHPLVRRDVFYAGRDVDRYLDAIDRGDRVSVVTGRGPSGPMHLGHVLPFYFAKYLQAEAGAHVVIPLSDDEKYFAKDQTLDEVQGHLRENLRDVLAVGFDPGRTTVVIDTADADVLYPLAADFAGELTTATVEATYGEPPNPGLGFYPAMQAVHILLPQLLAGPHPTLVPIAIDQDPHVRISRDIAGKERVPATKPAALHSRFLPSLEGDGKLSSSDDRATVELTDDRETVRETVLTHAYSGGKSSVEAHREHGGDPEVDVAYRLLAAMFEPDDDRLAEIARRYREGDLLSGELKELAAERIADFLEAHQERRAALAEDIERAAAPYRLDDDQRARLRKTPFAE